MRAKKEQKVQVKLTQFEFRVVIKALVDLRNSLIETGKPTEDVNELLLKLLK